MEDLIPPALVGPQDAVLDEGREHRAHRRLRGPGELRQVRSLVRDLRPRRRDEMVEEERRERLLLRRQRFDRTLQVVGDDLARAAELLQRRRAQGRRAGGALDFPQPLHHELEVRGLDPRAAVPVDGALARRGAELDLPCADAVEHVVDELRPRR